jgi:hypothetical protein
VPANRLNRLSASFVAVWVFAAAASAAPLTYRYTGEITVVSQNESNVIPNLAVGDPFSGYVTFESTGWHHTAGTVFATINGVDLLFTGQYIYGQVVLSPKLYEIRIAADNGGSIAGSTFNAVNFGPRLGDIDHSAGITTPFPATLNVEEFEINSFLLSGTVIGADADLDATGRLTAFWFVPEPTGTVMFAAGFAIVCALRSHKRRSHRRLADGPALDS